MIYHIESDITEVAYLGFLQHITSYFWNGFCVYYYIL